jgi:hypothetical protein
MSQLLERPRPRNRFFQRDILSHMGETICLSSHEIERLARPEPDLQEVISIPSPARIIDEDPERWDGLG